MSQRFMQTRAGAAACDSLHAALCSVDRQRRNDSTGIHRGNFFSIFLCLHLTNYFLLLTPRRLFPLDLS